MKVSRITAGAAFALAIAALVAFAAGTAFAAEKVYICHATGSSGNPFVAISVDAEAYWEHGHLDENGNPESGHESDFLAQSRDECDKK